MIRVKNFINGKNVVINWTAPLYQVEVTIIIPKLAENKYQVFGDWGLNYNVDINPEQPIKLTYKNMKTGDSEEICLDQNKIKISSPILNEIRKDYPYFYTVIDDKKDFRFELYADNTGDIKKVDIFRLEDEVMLYTQSICA